MGACVAAIGEWRVYVSYWTGWGRSYWTIVVGSSKIVVKYEFMLKIVNQPVRLVRAGYSQPETLDIVKK